MKMRMRPEIRSFFCLTDANIIGQVDLKFEGLER
jgi:hypothetical protein